ncbi:acetyltransferase PA2271 [Aspergillus lentulus]|uniref:Acetyltransferase PA2271 n=1 Tax=Aspergillus lentulus TaxID=293939 RepID=A0ABQ1A9N8_ASPLE|nr:acetyltransferase PA2271 [Aspergillus lentulus]GFF39777.1 acetyltransferase PA2271 [Aspergillus lentulus]GFF57918.1 acetyltransferase PA2271 [Aspergillus lentulus]GFF76922.1 acetyltransferase PA2271 [Aspergillus lentulus]GFF80410.1 acetyltransferase PA2271 [Aspergillus lentulus]GFG08542.1 acetyltransferase PA2271 [Aspergillus lentulus]
MATAPPTTKISIRLAVEEDIPQLNTIETSAAQLFRTVNLAWIADSPPLDPVTLRSMIAQQNVWVAVTADNTAVGFIAVQGLDGMLYIAEMDVHEDWQRRGIARMLLKEVEGQAREGGYEYVSLTTYRDLRFNGPFYARMGFEEVDVDIAGEGHARELEEQARGGHDRDRRCVMRKRV